MVQIDIASMSSGVHEVALKPAAGDLDLNEEEFSDIEARVRLDIGEQQILAQLSVSALANLVCDRTLVPFTQAVNGEYVVVFTRRPAEQAETDETIKPLDPTSRELDVTDELRDTLLLSIPLRKVAPEASDAQLVLTYGGEEDTGVSVDPRWEALRKLKKSG